VLLGTAALLVVMVNAAWQNGAAGAVTVPAIRHSARLAALLLAPVVVIAVYALGLRVADYGWTNDRIAAAACLLVAACYAAGYASAALRKGWLEKIAGVNIATAFVVLGVMLALLTPLADPARLSVNNQVARLGAGKIAPDKFDYAYLRFEGARYGRTALTQMQGTTGGKDAAVMRRGADLAMQLTSPAGRAAVAEAQAMPANLATNITVWPSGSSLPKSFVHTNWTSHAGQSSYLACLWRAGAQCDAYLVDVTGDGKPEVLLVAAERGGRAVVMAEDGKSEWRALATLPFDIAGCDTLKKNLVAGHVRAINPVANALEVGGQRIPMQSAEFTQGGNCPK
jgi:hypothetical protein